MELRGDEVEARGGGAAFGFVGPGCVGRGRLWDRDGDLLLAGEEVGGRHVGWGRHGDGDGHLLAGREAGGAVGAAVGAAVSSGHPVRCGRVGGAVGGVAVVVVDVLYDVAIAVRRRDVRDSVVVVDVVAVVLETSGYEARRLVAELDLLVLGW